MVTREKPAVKCAHCGREFFSVYHNAAYCSPQCRRDAARRRGQAAKQAREAQAHAGRR